MLTFFDKRGEHKHTLAILSEKGLIDSDGVARFLQPSEIRRNIIIAKLKKHGIHDQDAIDDILPKETLDFVTGFHPASDKVPTVELAMNFVEHTGKSAFFVEADIHNLGGLNTHFSNNHENSNKVYRQITDIFNEELNIIGEAAVFVRHGGDEFNSVVIGASTSDIRSAIAKIKSRVKVLTDESGLSNIPHPKHVGDDLYNGVGVYVGFSPIMPGANLSDIFEYSSRMVDMQKLGELHNVN